MELCLCFTHGPDKCKRPEKENHECGCSVHIKLIGDKRIYGPDKCKRIEKYGHRCSCYEFGSKKCKKIEREDHNCGCYNRKNACIRIEEDKHRCSCELTSSGPKTCRKHRNDTIITPSDKSELSLNNNDDNEGSSPNCECRIIGPLNCKKESDHNCICGIHPLACLFAGDTFETIIPKLSDIIKCEAVMNDKFVGEIDGVFTDIDTDETKSHKCVCSIIDDTSLCRSLFKHECICIFDYTREKGCRECKIPSMKNKIEAEKYFK